MKMSEYLHEMADIQEAVERGETEWGCYCCPKDTFCFDQGMGSEIGACYSKRPWNCPNRMKKYGVED